MQILATAYWSFAPGRGVVKACWDDERGAHVVHVAVEHGALYLPALLDVPLMVVEALAARLEEV